jgi:hypothetical protein
VLEGGRALRREHAQARDVAPVDVTAFFLVQARRNVPIRTEHLIILLSSSCSSPSNKPACASIGAPPASRTFLVTTKA